VKLRSGGGTVHLGYGLNVHPGESVADLLASLDVAGAVRSALGWSEPMGVGLRLAAAAARELDGDDHAIAEVVSALRAHRLYVFTANAFPFGAFHAVRVKEAVYEPDWRDPRRADYTMCAARVLSRLVSDESERAASLSTVPLGFRARASSTTDQRVAAAALRRCAAGLAALERSSGARVVLALEPEPACVLETTGEAARYFHEHLAPRGDAAVRTHLGVCVDACHAAVLGEDPALLLDELQRQGIAVAKIQLSAGVEVDLAGERDPQAEERALAALQRFQDGVYLHQVVETGVGGARAFDDLTPATSALARSRADGDGAPRRWRVHAHVPVFRSDLGALASTQPFLKRMLERLRRSTVSPHLEVETYTWDVLPSEARGASLVEDVARELAWSRQELVG
jgi:sugar phosphate isomerase/epimerase